MTQTHATLNGLVRFQVFRFPAAAWLLRKRASLGAHRSNKTDCDCYKIQENAASEVLNDKGKGGLRRHQLLNTIAVCARSPTTARGKSFTLFVCNARDVFGMRCERCTGEILAQLHRC